MWIALVTLAMAGAVVSVVGLVVVVIKRRAKTPWLWSLVGFAVLFVVGLGGIGANLTPEDKARYAEERKAEEEKKLREVAEQKARSDAKRKAEEEKNLREDAEQKTAAINTPPPVQPAETFDILGLRLGTPADEAAGAVTIEGAEVSKHEARYIDAEPVKSGIDISNGERAARVLALGNLGNLKDAEAGKAYLRAAFSYGSDPTVIWMRRVHKYPEDQRPLLSTFQAALVEKFGPPFRTIDRSDERALSLIWKRTTNNDPAIADSCESGLAADDLALFPTNTSPSTSGACGQWMKIKIHRAHDGEFVSAFDQVAGDVSEMIASSNRASAAKKARIAAERDAKLQKASSIEPEL